MLRCVTVCLAIVVTAGYPVSESENQQKCKLWKTGEGICQHVIYLFLLRITVNMCKFFFGCIIPAVKRVIHFWRHFTVTVLNMKNSFIPPNLLNVKYTNFKTISFYCIFTHTEYLSYIWSPLHLKSVKTISLYWRLYLYIIIRLHLNVRANVTCDLFVLVLTWMQTRKNIDQGIHKYWMCPYCYTVNCPSHCILI